MSPHEVVAWTGVAVVVGLVVGTLAVSSQALVRAWARVQWEQVVRAWRAFRLQRGWISVNALRGESRYARLRELMRR